jgi:alpha-tubulin suppressor-like RCC1 family protein
MASDVMLMAAGYNHNCAIKTDGSAWCWGRNSNGQLGDGTTTSQTTPVAVSGLASGVTRIAAGFLHTCAGRTDGSVWCWGWNFYGQVGDGTNTERATPVAVSGLASGVTQIAAGGSQSCAIRSNGSALCWGLNGSGQLGDGTTTHRYTPVAVTFGELAP